MGRTDHRIPARKLPDGGFDTIDLQSAARGAGGTAGERVVAFRSRQIWW